MNKKQKPEYVHFQPSAWLSDSDVQAWTDDLLGAYFRIVLYLYTNNGTVAEQQIQNLVRPCCKSATEVCKLIRHKFHRRNTKLFHIRVNKELAAARKLMQAKQAAGVKGAAKRWQNHNGANGTANGAVIAKESKGKESKVKKKSARFTPPTLTEVQAYIDSDADKLSIVSAQEFIDCYEKTEPKWHDTRGSPIRNWKLKVRTWAKFNRKEKADASDSRKSFADQQSAHGEVIDD